LKSFSPMINRSPSAFPYMLTALDFKMGPNTEIVIAAEPEDKEARIFSAKLGEKFSPRQAVIWHAPGERGSAIEKLVPFVKNQTQINKKATFYVCENYACKLPVHTAEKALALIK